MLEECADALETLCYVEKEVLELRGFGGDEVEVDACARDKIECEWDEGDIFRL